jgi:hypothetical protein
MSENALLGRSFENTVEFIKPKNGVYQVTPIRVANDYVAIAPILSQKTSAIITIEEEPTIGIIVGIGPLVDEEMSNAFPIGSIVKFATKPAMCNLDNLYPTYGSVRIVLVRYSNIQAGVPGDAGDVVYIVGVDKAKE